VFHYYISWCLKFFRPIQIAIKKFKVFFYSNGQPWQLNLMGLKFFIYTLNKIVNITPKVERHTNTQFWLTSVWIKFSSFGQCLKHHGWNSMYSIVEIYIFKLISHIQFGDFKTQQT